MKWLPWKYHYLHCPIVTEYTSSNKSSEEKDFYFFSMWSESDFYYIMMIITLQYHLSFETTAQEFSAYYTV